MKKLIAIFLALATMLAIASCAPNNGGNNGGGNGGGNGGINPPDSVSEQQKILDALSSLIRASAPTKSEIYTKTGDDYLFLESNLSVTMGELSGLEAALYVYEYEEFNDLGATEAKSFKKETQEYVEGYGVRIDGGSWDKDSPSFVRKIQPYRINLDSELIKDFLVNETKTEFSFVIPYDNIGDVLEKLNVSTIVSDVKVEIETDGASVTDMRFEYEIKSISNIETPKVTIDAVYSYGLHPITLIDEK